MIETIALDFDGVVHDYSGGWTGFDPTGEPVPGAREFVEWAQAEGYEVIISSCRAYTQLGRLGVQHWLGRHGFPIMAVTCEKPHAKFYIDDRGIRFEGCFGQVRELMQRPVWFEAQTEPKFDP